MILLTAFSQKQSHPALFLRADRQEDGRRTFKLVEGEPITSFGEDLCRDISRRTERDAARGAGARAGAGMILSLSATWRGLSDRLAGALYAQTLIAISAVARNYVRDDGIPPPASHPSTSGTR